MYGGVGWDVGRRGGEREREKEREREEKGGGGSAFDENSPGSFVHSLACTPHTSKHLYWVRIDG